MRHEGLEAFCWQDGHGCGAFWSEAVGWREVVPAHVMRRNCCMHGTAGLFHCGRLPRCQHGVTASGSLGICDDAAGPWRRTYSHT